MADWIELDLTGPAGGLDVFVVPLAGSVASARGALPARSVLSALSALSPAERARADRFRYADDRRRYVRSHAALREVLARRLGGAPANVRLRAGRNGRPELVGYGDDAPRFNLSHSGDVALVAVADRAVGVDVERLRPNLDAGALADRYFPADEAATVAADPADFARLWTRKEACVKASGGRLVQGLRLPVLSIGPAGLVRDPHGRLGGPWYVVDVPAPPGYAAAVAVELDKSRSGVPA